MDENKPCRRWLNFAIRDLLWAIVVLGLLVAWWTEKTAGAKLAKRLLWTECEAAVFFQDRQNAAIKLEAAEDKLRKERFRWKYIQGYRKDGTPYGFMVEDEPPPASRP